MIYQIIHIYKIQDNKDNALTFYGSTTANLDSIVRHENLNNKSETKFIIERNNYKIEFLESYANVDDLVVNKRINSYTSNFSCMNKLILITTNKSEQFKKTQLEWYKNNKKKILERAREKVNCPMCNNILSKTYLNAHLKKYCKKRTKPNQLSTMSVLT